MKTRMKSRRFFALVMALMMLAALLPAAAFMESDMAEYWEDAASDFAPDFFDEEEQVSYAGEEPWGDWTDDDPALEADNEVTFGESLEGRIAAGGHAYVMTTQATIVYSAPQMADPIFIVTQGGAVLLATEYRTRSGINSVMVWFITEGNDVIAGYVAANEVEDAVLLDEEAFAMAGILGYDLVSTDAGDLYAFVAMGDRFINNTTDDEEVTAELPFEPIAEQAPAEAANHDEPVDDVDESDDHYDSSATEESPADTRSANIGDYISVTPMTRVFLGIDGTATDHYLGDLCVGVFVNDATVQVMDVERDNFDRCWYEVRYLFGNENPDGTYAWVDDGFVYVLAPETDDTSERECSVTDYAFSSTPAAPVPRQFAIGIMAATTPMVGFSLKTIYAPTGNFWVGQTGVHGDSYGDRDSLALATSPGYGTIYATPHYLSGTIVYCLEHTMNSPGGRVSGGTGNWPTGPYTIVDLDGYRMTPITRQYSKRLPCTPLDGLSGIPTLSWRLTATTRIIWSGRARRASMPSEKW